MPISEHFLFFLKQVFLKFFIDLLSKPEIIYPLSVLRLNKLILKIKFIGTKTNNPIETQKQTAKILGCSDSTIKIIKNVKV